MPVKAVVSLAEFKALVAGSKAVAVDFYATWCGPCRMISPRFEQYSEKYPTVTFVKVDTDQAPEIASSMQIAAMPTFIFFKDGAKCATFVGADPAQVEANVAKIA